VGLETELGDEARLREHVRVEGVGLVVVEVDVAGVDRAGVAPAVVFDVFVIVFVWVEESKGDPIMRE
jgi:hypothetical protein